MGVTNNAKSVIAANMTGSALSTHMAVGAGSTIFSASQTTLVSEWDRNSLSSVDTATPYEVTLICDFTPVEMSGLSMREFGTFTLGSVMLNRETVTGSVVFDGEQGLQIQQTFKFYL